MEKGMRGQSPLPLGKTPVIPEEVSLVAPQLEPHLNRGICVSSGGWSTGRHEALPSGSPQFLLWSISTWTGSLSSFYLNLSICFYGMLTHFLWACALSREGQLVTDFCVITLQILKDSY